MEGQKQRKIMIIIVILLCLLIGFADSDNWMLETVTEGKNMSHPDQEPESPVSDHEGSIPEPEASNPAPEFYEPEPEGVPEGMGPEYSKAVDTVGVAWHIHVYFVATLFGAVALVTLVHTAMLLRIPRFPHKQYYFILNFLLITCCVLRCIYMTVDAYNVHRIFPVVLQFLLLDILYPFVASSFYLVFTAMLALTSITFISGKLFSVGSTVCIISFNFIFTILSDIITVYSMAGNVLRQMCALYFILWGFVAFISSLTIFIKMYKAIKKQKQTLQSYSMERLTQTNQSHTKKKKVPTATLR